MCCFGEEEEDEKEGEEWTPIRTRSWSRKKILDGEERDHDSLRGKKTKGTQEEEENRKTDTQLLLG